MNATKPATLLAPDARKLVERPLLALLELREGLEHALERHVDEMREFAPEMRVRRAFMSGRWVIGVHAGGRVGGTDSFSRLDFEIEVDVPGKSLSVGTHCTVRQVDGRQHELEVSLGDADPAEVLGAFVESTMLEFASRYFER